MGITIGLGLAILSLLMIGLHLYGTLLSLMHYRDSSLKVRDRLRQYEPVSILKPMKGADSGIEENLRTFFTLAYPEYEIIFSVASVDDPVIEVVRGLMAEFPQIPARLIVGDLNVGPNPKVNNMIQSYYTAAHDLILVSDSNVRVWPEYLKRAVEHLHPGAGLVTAFVTAQAPQGLGGHLEMIYMNTFFARWFALANSVGEPLVLGKSMLFKKSVAERFGGISNLARYLAEDYMTGQAMRHLGLRTELMVDPIPQIIGRHSFKAFWQRHLRWGRMRKSQAPLALAGEVLCVSFVSGLLGMIGFSLRFHTSPAQFFGLYMGVWFLCDLAIMLRLRTPMHWTLPFIWMIRELLALPLWFDIWRGNTVNWRGNQMRLEPGGVLAEVNL